MKLHEPLRRIGVIGDIHCEDELLAATLTFLQTQSLDLICAVGDICDGPGDLNRCCALLMEHKVATVRGNHERWLFNNEMRGVPDASSRFKLDLMTWGWLPHLPIALSFETVAGRMMLCHGLGGQDMEGVWPHDNELTLHSNYALWILVKRSDYCFVVNGHTHQRLVRSFGPLTIINAGTIFREHKPCCCVVDFAAGFVQYYDLPYYEGQFAEGVAVADRFALPIEPISPLQL